MKPELPYKGGLEQDAFSGWRKVLCAMGRPGQVKKAQRQYNKRVRRNQKTLIQEAEVVDEQ